MAIGIEANAISKQEVEVLRWYVQNYVQISTLGRKCYQDLMKFMSILTNSLKFL